MRFIQTIFLTIFLIGISFMGCSNKNESEKSEGILYWVNVDDSLNMRENPDASSKVVHSLNRGDTVFLLKKTNSKFNIDDINYNWVQVQLVDSVGNKLISGFVVEKFLSATEPKPLESNSSFLKNIEGKYLLINNADMKNINCKNKLAHFPAVIINQNGSGSYNNDFDLESTISWNSINDQTITIQVTDSGTFQISEMDNSGELNVKFLDSMIVKDNSKIYNAIACE